jgi:uncharacterized protein (DUF849 family)
VLLKACLNGSHGPAAHPRLPVRPAELAIAARDAVRAGADAIHLHPKDADGADTLDAVAAHDALAAVRAAIPGVPVGITTGAWSVRDPGERVNAVAAWTELPDFASVNWHEPGATAVADVLLDKGIGVEAGLWNPAAVEVWHGWPRRQECLRVLLEVEQDLSAYDALAAAQGLVEALAARGNNLPVLMHGNQGSCWPVLAEAVRLGFDLRIGLEDTFVLQDGSPATDNADLVAAAGLIVATDG